jgi:hypothetical protein
MSLNLADRASYRNRGGIVQWLVSHYKRWRFFNKCRTGVVVKRNAEFWLTDGAVLEIGDRSTILDFAFSSSQNRTRKCSSVTIRSSEGTP